MPDDDEVQTGVPDNPVLPAWADKAGAYLTDRGTLIRIGVFALGAVLGAIGIVTFFKAPITSAAKTAVKVVT